MVRLRLSFALAPLLLLGVARSGSLAADGAAEFDPPVSIVETLDSGRLFPTFADVDGDAKLDLLVGGTAVSGGGRLLVYSNQGTNVRPAYTKAMWFDETVPTARIPDGWNRAEFTPRFGDIDGDGRLDLVSGSNCCDPRSVHLFLGMPESSFAARRTVRFDLPGANPNFLALERGRTRPHLVDWNADGHTDLVIGHVGRGRLLVSAGPLVDQSEVAVKPFELPLLQNQHPTHFDFADWDGDGRFDLLTAMQHRKKTNDSFRYGVFWFRNTAAEDEPKFAPASHLFDIAEPWELNGFAVVDWGRDGRLDIVTGVTKDWERRKGGGWSADSRLWLYRRKAESL